MGGSISNENVRINLLMDPVLKSKIQHYGKMSNRSANAEVLRILEGTIEKKPTEGQFAFESEVNQRKTARMNLVVPKALKEKLSAEAEEKKRSLNNYICTKLLIFFEDIWPDSL